MNLAPGDTPGPRLSFFLALGLLLVLVVSLVFGLIYGAADYADIEHLRRIRYHDGTFLYLPIKLPPAEFARAKWALLALLLTSGAVFTWQIGGAGRLYQEVRALQRERRNSMSLLGPWRALRPAERRIALALFAALLLVRGYYLLNFPLYGDEVVTYTFFVREGAVAATGFYPIPNNHLLYSGLCWLFSLLSQNFYFTTRLPTYLISAVGTAVVGLLLLRHTSFRVAALTVFLFGFFPYALFQAVVGRGYFLLAVCAQLGFVAVLALLNGTRRPRRAWATLVVSSVAGLYAMPTYLLVFGGLFGSLGISALWRRDGPQLVRLLAASLVTGLVALLLYAPVLVISGPQALFSNSYVTPRAAGFAFGPMLTFVYNIEGQMFGSLRLSLLATLGLSIAALLVGFRLADGGTLRRLVWPAVLVLWLPYALLLARGVYPPMRVLSFRAFFVFWLGALLTDALLRWRPLRPLGARPALTVALPVALWTVLGLIPFQRRADIEVQRNARVADTYAWLRQQQARRVLTTHGHYQMYLLFYSQTDGRPLAIDAAPQPGVRYDYQLVNKEASEAAPADGTLVRENADVRVYGLPR